MPTLSLAAADDLTQRRPESVLAASVGNVFAGDASDGALCGDRTEAQARHHHHRRLRLRLRADRRLPGRIPERRRLHRQQTLAAVGHPRLHALCRADQRLRRRLPGLCRVEPAALYEVSTPMRASNIRWWRERPAATTPCCKSFGDEAIGSSQLLPLHARSRDRQQQTLHRRDAEELRYRSRLLCRRTLCQLPGGRRGPQDGRR